MLSSFPMNKLKKASLQPQWYNLVVRSQSLHTKGAFGVVHGEIITGYLFTNYTTTNKRLVMSSNLPHWMMIDLLFASTASTFSRRHVV